MPAAKPEGLNRMHKTAAEKAASAQREESLRPRSTLPSDAPAQLKGHKVAQAVWRRMMRMYAELDAEIVTRLDLDLLVDYCMMTEQVLELDEMRKSAIKVWETINKAFEAIEPNADITEAYKLALQVQDALGDVVKLDGRVDRKRDMLLKLRQSLYLTPRARAGAAPKRKEKEQPKDDMESLLDDVESFMNGEA